MHVCMYGLIWSGLVWSGMGWHGMAWHGMAWHGMAWHGMYVGWLVGWLVGMCVYACAHVGVLHIVYTRVYICVAQITVPGGTRCQPTGCGGAFE